MWDLTCIYWVFGIPDVVKILMVLFWVSFNQNFGWSDRHCLHLVLDLVSAADIRIDAFRLFPIYWFRFWFIFIFFQSAALLVAYIWFSSYFRLLRTRNFWTLHQFICWALCVELYLWRLAAVTPHHFVAEVAEIVVVIDQTLELAVRAQILDFGLNSLQT